MASGGVVCLPWNGMCRHMISTFHFALYVGISCVGYELSRSSALRQMQRALAEKEATNAQLLQVSKAKERFIANTSHGAPASPTIRS